MPKLLSNNWLPALPSHERLKFHGFKEGMHA
jgi:hypothetical protein